MFRPVPVAIAAAVLSAAGAGTVLGGETDRAEYDFTLTSRAPAASSGVSVRVFFKDPDDAEAKPPALDTAELELPPGMKIDDEAVPQCEATDDDFEMHGRDACPDDTQVGAGAVTVMTGVSPADPSTLDIVAYNGAGELIEVVFFPDTNVVAGIDRVTIEDGKLVAHPPRPPGGPPDGRTAIRELTLDVPARTGPTGRAYVTTPPDCPTGGWISRGHFGFADGGETVVESRTPCGPEATALPEIEVSIDPARVETGERTRFRVRAKSSERHCVAHARVRLAGRRTRTGRRGRARVTARFAEPGVRRVKVSKRGCRRGRALMRVVDAGS
jgi:hypothetical protein